jgi:hypothetical protein
MAMQPFLGQYEYEKMKPVFDVNPHLKFENTSFKHNLQFILVMSYENNVF